MRPHTLDALYLLLKRRAGSGDAASSYTAQLLAKGRGKIAQKLGEEVVETIVAAMQDDREEMVKESADVLYHWLVLLLDADINPEQVWQELERRFAQSGLEEKQGRKRG